MVLVLQFSLFVFVTSIRVGRGRELLHKFAFNLIFDQWGWDLFGLGFMCSQVCEAFAKIGWCSPNTISSPRKHSVGRWWKLEVNGVQFYLPSAWKFSVENRSVAFRHRWLYPLWRNQQKQVTFVAHPCKSYHETSNWMRRKWSWLQSPRNKNMNKDCKDIAMKFNTFSNFRLADDNFLRDDKRKG